MEKMKLELRKELKFLTKEAQDLEIEKNKNKLIDNVNIKELAKEIYLNRGIDINKLNNNIINKLFTSISLLSKNFKEKDSKLRKKMIIDIVYLVILIILLKIPFDLVRDIGYEYIEIISTNNVFYTIWNLVFLLLYTVTIICVCVVSFNNFNENYNK